MVKITTNGNSKWLLPAVALGSMAFGAILLHPIMKKLDIFDDDDHGRWRGGRHGKKRKYRDIGQLVSDLDDNDEAYIITDEDFSHLDIAKKPLNLNRKIKEGKVERVLYGDKMMADKPVINTTFSGYVNTVSPYGQGPAREFTRLQGAESLSRSNTRGNTLNLY